MARKSVSKFKRSGVKKLWMEKGKSLCCIDSWRNQQMATRRYYTYLLFSSISQLENGAYLIWKKN